MSTGMGYPLACQSVNSLNSAKEARAPQGVLENTTPIISTWDIGPFMSTTCPRRRALSVSLPPWDRCSWWWRCGELLLLRRCSWQLMELGQCQWRFYPAVELGESVQCWLKQIYHTVYWPRRWSQQWSSCSHPWRAAACCSARSQHQPSRSRLGLAAVKKNRLD